MGKLQCNLGDSEPKDDAVAEITPASSAKHFGRASTFSGPNLQSQGSGIPTSSPPSRRSLAAFNEEVEPSRMNTSALATGKFFRVPLFADRKMEEDWQEMYTEEKIAWGKKVAIILALLATGFLAVNMLPPYDKSTFWRRCACGGELAVFVLLEVILVKCPSPKLSSLLYDIIIVVSFLMATWVASMTSDRTAKLLGYPDETWTLVSLQEANGSLLVGALFSFIALFCRPHLQFNIVFYLLGIPVVMMCPLTLGSKEWELMAAATDYQFDKHGEHVDPWPHEYAVILRAGYLFIIGSFSYWTARNQEVNQRKMYSQYYSTQKYLKLQQAQGSKKEKNRLAVAEGASAFERMALIRNGSDDGGVFAQDKQFPYVPQPAAFGEIADIEAQVSTPNVSLALAKKATSDPASSQKALLGLAEKMCNPGYRLKEFFDDCAVALPELKLFVSEDNTAAPAYQQTMGALFAIYWFLRMDVDGPDGFCFGVDKDWNVIKKKSKVSVIVAEENDLSADEVREVTYKQTDWKAFTSLVDKAGCGKGKPNASSQVAAVLVKIVLRGLMKVRGLKPSVQEKHAPFKGFDQGATLEEPSQALAYVLEFFPDLFPSYAGLPSEQQKSVLAAQGAKDFNLSWLIQAEAPPSNLTSLKSTLSTVEDVGIYALHWFAELAGAEATPLAGAERPVLYVPRGMLSKLLMAVPTLMKLPSATETQVMEEYLRTQAASIAEASGSRASATIPEDPSAVAQLRLVVMSQDSTKIIDMFKSLEPGDKERLQVEFARTGCSTQSFKGCDTEEAHGPAFVVPGSAAFLQAHIQDPREILLAAVRIVLEVQAQARVIFPLSEKHAGDSIVLDMAALKGVDVMEVANPTAGDMWLLHQTSEKEAAVKRMRATNVNELTKTGATIHIFDFGHVFVSPEDDPDAAPTLGRPNFQGKWKCIDTWGLDAFLQKVMGSGYIQRTAASKAPWPSWQFAQEGDSMTFTNFTAMGELQENFLVDGPEYITIDGWKREIKCKAAWEGDTLIISRTGPEGRFREERRLDDQEHLQFSLRKLDAATGKAGEMAWGRVFERSG